MWAKEVTMVLKAAGTIEDYAQSPEVVKEGLHQQLQCLAPQCILTVRVTVGSVVLTVLATDARPDSQIESAVAAMRAAPLPTLSNALGITLEEGPTVESVESVQVAVHPRTINVIQVRALKPPSNSVFGIKAFGSQKGCQVLK